MGLKNRLLLLGKIISRGSFSLDAAVCTVHAAQHLACLKYQFLPRAKIGQLCQRPSAEAAVTLAIGSGGWGGRKKFSIGLSEIKLPNLRNGDGPRNGPLLDLCCFREHSPLGLAIQGREKMEVGR